MPYSKDPGKYPPELQLLPELLMHTTETTFRIPVESRSVAYGKRTQVQAYFSAVRRKAEEMRALAERTLDKRLKAAQLAAPTRANAPNATPEVRAKAIRMTEDDIHEAEGVARTWEDRNETLNGWMVRVVDKPGEWAVEITRRTLGDFGKAMLAAFDALPKKPTAESGDTSPALTTDSTVPVRQQIVTEGIMPPTDTTLEAQLAMLRQAAATLPPKN